MKVSEKCVGCSQCIVFCKYGAITARGRAVISEAACRNCGICVTCCPTGAIRYENKDSAEASL